MMEKEHAISQNTALDMNNPRLENKLIAMVCGLE